MPTKRIPLFGSLTNRNSNPVSFADKDQRFENCYPEVTKNPISGRTTVCLYKRLGTEHVAASAEASYTGVGYSFVWTGFSSGSIGVVPFMNSTTLKLRRTSNGTVLGTSIAGITDSSPRIRISETVISDTANLVILAGKVSNVYNYAWYFPEGGAFTEITSTNFPANQTPQLLVVGDAAHMDGYMFVMTQNGQIHNSDINSLANWSAGSYITCGDYPDLGSGVARYQNYLVGFGHKSMEFFVNAGNPSGSPLRRIGVTKRIGIIPAGLTRRYINVGDDLFLIGVEPDAGTFGVFKLNGTDKPVKVSNAAVDKILYANATVSFGGTFTMHGMTHFFLGNISAEGGALAPHPAYCLNTGIWWWLRPSAGQTNWVASIGDSSNSFFTTDTVAGKGYYKTTQTSPVFQDDGTAYSAVIQTEPIDFGSNKRKFFSQADLIGDVQTTAGNTVLSWSDDDYVTFSSGRNIDMSVAPARAFRLESGRRRAFKITDSVNRPLRLEAIDITYTEGVS